MTRSISAASGNGRAPSWISTRVGRYAASASSPSRTESCRVGAARDRRQHVEPGDGAIEQLAVFRPDRHQHPGDPRMAGERRRPHGAARVAPPSGRYCLGSVAAEPRCRGRPRQPERKSSPCAKLAANASSASCADSCVTSMLQLQKEYALDVCLIDRHSLIFCINYEHLSRLCDARRPGDPGADVGRDRSAVPPAGQARRARVSSSPR